MGALYDGTSPARHRRNEDLWPAASGRILMQRRADSGNWALPGGGMEICFIDPAELPGLPIHPTQQLRINHYLDNRNSPYLG